jgi:hypothetical protein
MKRVWWLGLAMGCMTVPGGWGADGLWHVSPAGNDAATGESSRPLRTVGESLKRAGASSAPVRRVVLQSGRHEVADPLRLGPEHSGLTLEGASGQRVVISGGTRLTGWREVSGRPGLWELPLPSVRAGEWYFHTLYVDGVRQVRAREPDGEFFRAAGKLGTNRPAWLPVAPGNVKRDWTNYPDMRLVMLQKWTDLQVPVLEVDEAGGRVRLPDGPPAPWRDVPDARYWIENVPDALDEPGEWYLDRLVGLLRWRAPAGVNPNRALVVAPRLATLLEVTGNETQAVTGVSVRGVTLAETDFEMPPMGIQSPQAAMPVRGVVRVRFSEGGTLANCTIRQVGGYGIDLGRGARGWSVLACVVEDAGGGGVRIGEPSDLETNGPRVCAGHVVSDCHLHRLGRVFAPAAGVAVFQSAGNRITHNEVNDLYYTAVSVGWTWGYRASPCYSNEVAYNHLHTIGQGVLSDMGGVYTLGPQPGTVVHHNRIHDVESYDYGGWGLYTDEGSSGIVMASNLVSRCKSAGFHQHYGRENRIVGNVFVQNREHQLMRTREEDHVSFEFTDNVVWFDSGQLLGSNWKNGRFVMRNNVYWDARAGTNEAAWRMGPFNWAEWRARGHDEGTVWEDPGFANAKAGDLRPAPGGWLARHLGGVPAREGTGPRVPAGAP